MNSYLRSLENPQHLEWEVERAENKTTARKLLSSLTKFIKECLDALKDDDSEEALDPSVGEFFAAEPEGDPKQEERAENLSDSVNTIKVKKNPVSAKSTGILSESVDGVVIRRTLPLQQIDEVQVFSAACFKRTAGYPLAHIPIHHDFQQNLR